MKKLVWCVGISLFIIFWVCLIATASASEPQKLAKKFSELNRESAVDMIRQSGLVSVFYEVPVGPKVNVDAYIEARGKFTSNIYGCLQKLEYLYFVPRKVFEGVPPWYDITVTEKGKTMGKVVSKPGGNYKLVYVFKVCDRAVKGVTGIKKTNDASAIAEFQWHNCNLNEVYSCIFQPQEIINTGRAIFGKYDDGWRIENIDLGLGPRRRR